MPKPADDSIQGRIDRAREEGYEYPVPPGLEKLDEYGENLWKLYIPAKTRWKDSELIQLHMLCQQHSMLRDMRADPDTRPGDLISWQKMMQGQVRVLGLNAPHNVAQQNCRDGQPSATRGKRKPEAAKVSLLK